MAAGKKKPNQEVTAKKIAVKKVPAKSAYSPKSDITARDAPKRVMPSTPTPDIASPPRRNGRSKLK